MVKVSLCDTRLTEAGQPSVFFSSRTCGFWVKWFDYVISFVTATSCNYWSCMNFIYFDYFPCVGEKTSIEQASLYCTIKVIPVFQQVPLALAMFHHHHAHEYLNYYPASIDQPGLTSLIQTWRS